ncbi:MAG: transposase, partial [Bryobacteraceae bacterium]|nr:transposase [Bryobacteraceae bacterium]
MPWPNKHAIQSSDWSRSGCRVSPRPPEAPTDTGQERQAFGESPNPACVAILGYGPKDSGEVPLNPRTVYLPAEYARHYGVAILGYCLMPNYVHLILVPRDAEALGRLFRRLHGDYARAIHVRLRCKGRWMKNIS